MVIEGLQRTENDLLAAARQGDAEAFCALVRPLEARLLRQVTGLCGNGSLAEGLVAETMVEAWRCLERYNQTCRLSTWLYAILLHRWQKAARRARSRPPSLSSLPPAQAEALEERQQQVSALTPSPAEALARREFLSEVRDLLERLPEKHRAVILLRFYEDASLEDMAAVLECPLATVKSRLLHALDKLRKMKMILAEKPRDKQMKKL